MGNNTKSSIKGKRFSALVFPLFLFFHFSFVIGQIESSSVGTEYFISTTAFPMEKKDLRLKIQPYGAALRYGCTERITVGASISWLLLPATVDFNYLVYDRNDHFKVSLKAEGAYFSWGFKVLQKENAYYMGTVKLISTFGSLDKNMSVALGYGRLSPFVDRILKDPYYDESLEHQEESWFTDHYLGPIVSFSGIKKLGGRASFIFDIQSFGSRIDKIVSYRWQYQLLSDNNYLNIRLPVIRSVTNIGMIAQLGLRLQKSERKAFQFSIVTIGGIRSYGDMKIAENRNIWFLPIPTFSWIRNL